MRFSLLCISSMALQSTMDQSGSKSTSYLFSIDAYSPNHSFTRSDRLCLWQVAV
jgi:hypothetical protein